MKGKVEGSKGRRKEGGRAVNCERMYVCELNGMTQMFL